MRNDTFYTNTIVRKKSGKMTSLHVPSLPVTWLPFMSHPLTMLLPVMRNCTFRTTAMKKRRSGNALLGMCKTYFRLWRHFRSHDFMWRHFRSGPLPVTSLPVTHTQYPWKNIEGRHSSFPLGVYVKGIAKAFNWLKCLGGFLHLKPTAGCQISTLIF
jgi:hypothetical protein